MRLQLQAQSMGLTGSQRRHLARHSVMFAWQSYLPWSRIIYLFVCGISVTSGQLINELFPDCTRSCFLQVVLRRRSGDRIHEIRCLFVAVGPDARFIVLPHWDNVS